MQTSNGHQRGYRRHIRDVGASSAVPREAILRTMLESPARTAEPDADSEIAIRRENTEEAGMTVDKIVRGGDIWTVAHFSDEFATIFAGSGQRFGSSSSTQGGL